MPPAPAEQLPPVCPRCAYDLSGVTAAWRSSCPLSGLCSECGLTFAWPDVLRRDRRRIPWLFEHARGVFPSLLAAWATWWRILIPAYFWRRIGLHNTVSVPRLLLWPVVVILPLHAAGAIAACVEWWFILAWQPRFRSGPNFVSGMVNAWTYPVAYLFNPPPISWTRWRVSWQLDEWPVLARALPAVQLTWPALVLVLPATRRLARVRPAHILRATVYSFWWIPVLAAMRLVDELITLSHRLDASGARPGKGGVADWLRAVTDIRTTQFLHETTGSLILALLVIWTAWWWHQVIVRHWKLREGASVWTMLLVPVLLVGLMTTVFWQMMVSRYGEG